MKCMWKHWGSTIPVVPRSFFFLGPVCTRWLIPITGCTAAAPPPVEAELVGRRLSVEEGSPAESRGLTLAGTTGASSEDINNYCQLYSKLTVINKPLNLCHYSNKEVSFVGFWTGTAMYRGSICLCLLPVFNRRHFPIVDLVLCWHICQQMLFI